MRLFRSCLNKRKDALIRKHECLQNLYWLSYLGHALLRVNGFHATLPSRAERYAIADIPPGGFSPLPKLPSLKYFKLFSGRPDFMINQWVEAAFHPQPPLPHRGYLSMHDAAPAAATVSG